MSNLTNVQKQKIFNAIVVCVLAIFAVFGYGLSVAQMAVPAPGVVVGSQSLSEQKFSNIRVDGTSHLIGVVTADGAVNVAGAFTASAISPTFSTAVNVVGTTSVKGDAMVATTTLSALGTLAVTGASSFTGTTTFSAQNIYSSALITPTDGGIVTPTAKLVSMNPAAAVTVTLAACTTGMETILYNQANFALIVSDTGNGVLAGAQTLGQYDALMLACFATKWVQVSALSAN
jgi:hypothetical protein